MNISGKEEVDCLHLYAMVCKSTANASPPHYSNFQVFHKNIAAQYIAGIGVHWYWDHVAPTILLDKTHDAFPDKFILSTEACFTKQLWEKTVVHLGSWDRGEQYAESVIEVG